MTTQPWFKFYASDYLLDPAVDGMPREAEALLVRMWCICHREGSCPANVEALARKTQCSQQYVAQFKPLCEPFFKLREGRLYSRRMEEEKLRSAQASRNANKRYGKQMAEQSALQTAVPRSDYDSDSGFKGVVVDSVSSLLEKAKKVCRMCSGMGKLHVAPHIPGPRLIPCPKCCVRAIA